MKSLRWKRKRLYSHFAVHQVHFRRCISHCLRSITTLSFYLLFVITKQISCSKNGRSAVRIKHVFFITCWRLQKVALLCRWCATKSKGKCWWTINVSRLKMNPLRNNILDSLTSTTQTTRHSYNYYTEKKRWIINYNVVLALFTTPLRVVQCRGDDTSYYSRLNLS